MSAATGRGVLFLAHGAERGGPTRMLLAFLRWWREHLDVPFEVGLLRGGELEDDLRELAPVHLLEELDGAPVADVTSPRSRWELRRQWRRLDGFDLTYVNTAWTGRALGYLPTPHRLLVHVHELDLGFGEVLRPADRRRLLADADRFVVGCGPVRDLLVDRYGVEAARVALHPYFLVDEPRGFPAGGRGRREALGIPLDAPVVGVVAVTDWRKAPDLMLEAMWHLDRRLPGRAAHLVWVGGPSAGGVDATPTAAEVAALGLEGRVHFVGHQRALWDWYRAFDVFALPSREDAFPLACLEAAAVEVPIVCFDTGGMADFVQEDAGRVVPFPRVERFADALAGLLDDDVGRAGAGATAAARVRTDHDLDGRAPALADEVRSLIGST